MPWTNNEAGPECFCGNPTVVKTEGLSKPFLFCLFHSYEAAAMFPLPDDKPPWWPNPPSRDALRDYMQTATPIKDEED